MKRRLNHKAFSLIELLVAIGLIGLLSVMLVMGVGKMRTNGKRQQTHVTLENLRAMYADYDSNRRVPFGMGHNTFASMALVERSAMLDSVYLPCPGNVAADATTTDRTGTIVQLTRDFMGQMMQYPATAAAIGKLPAGAIMTFPSAYPVGLPTWAVGSTPLVNSLWAFPAGSVYVRTQVYTDPSILPYGSIQPDIAQNGPPNSYFWMPVLPVPSPILPLSTPVLLDAWGNPIIFVMGGVLGVRPGNAAGLGFPLIAGGSQLQIKSPDFRPFFASAGPDGDFSKGDDNVYSFEK